MLNSERKMLISTTIGGAIGVFDFLTFVFLSPLIAKLFFPSHISGLSILFTYIVISISYVFRPLGGVVLAFLSDKYGRKTIFIFTIFSMGIPSLIIGLLPTYQHIGVLSTIIIIIMRIMQGFALGGEIPGSVTYIRENFSKTNYFVDCAWLTFGANIGVVASSQLLDLLYSETSTEFMYSFGWRIPFIIVGIVSFCGFIFRKMAVANTNSIAVAKTKAKSRVPLSELFREYKRSILAGFVLALMVSITTSAFQIFLPDILANYKYISFKFATDLSATGAIILAFASLFFALLTKYIKPLTIIITCTTSLIIFLLLITLLSLKFDINTYLLYIVAIISFLISGVNGLFLGILGKIFPAQVRFSGVSICFNGAYIFGAGLSPIWIDLIFKINNSYNYILLLVAFIIAICALTFIGISINRSAYTE